ncbi:multiple epidermal growth factor-like domains protein 10 [Saccostrea cucullata]|uniref:multiple epidermal growth factor-like domains protein 10 n=1 Tax=Saccostrea cuccullata TaxID=36930 RepID=UPI002ED20745
MYTGVMLISFLFFDMAVLKRMLTILLLGVFHGYDIGRCSPNCVDQLFDWRGSCIRGCKEGYWGFKCENDCPLGCSTRVCNRINGVCNSCIDGFFGDKCEEICSQTCYGQRCNKDRDLCTSKCEKRHDGIHCQTRCGNCTPWICERPNGYCALCKTGFYGLTCERKCNINCVNQECTRIIGGCRHGCKNGFYGSRCSLLCSKNCGRVSCYMNGFCMGGCKQNWTGDKCDRCDSTHFGPDCSHLCSANCNRQVCNNVTGSCTYGCKSGYYSENCETKCSESCSSSCNRFSGECKGSCQDGNYGYYCNNTCNKNCINRCSRINGVCTFGCIDGKFGAYCLQTCGGGCISGCHQVHGRCSCKTGWHGQNCDECSQSYYGQERDKLCSPTCINGTCFSNNGSCKDGFNRIFFAEIDTSATNQAIGSDKTSFIYPVLYTGIPILLIVTTFIVLYLRQILYKRQGSRMKQNQHNSNTDTNRRINERTENLSYTELGQLSQPSCYEELK